MDSKDPCNSAVGANLTPSAEQLKHLRRVALGEVAADLIIENVRVLSLATGEILHRKVAIADGFIAAVVPFDHRFCAVEHFDGANCFLAPGFIDTHIHIEYSLLTPGEFARCVLPRGTTCVLADPNCVGNVLGAKGMEWAGETTTPLKILQQISHRIPRAPHLELGGATVAEAEQLEFLGSAGAVGVGESVPFGFDDQAARFQAAALSMGKRCTGHSARVVDELLWAYAATGVSDDHNAVHIDEVLDRLRLGQMITVMSGSMNDNLPLTFAEPELLKGAYRNFSFCADDKHVGDLVKTGHIDHHVRSAIAKGVPLLEAYRMASYNAACFYRLDHIIGQIAPARCADLLLIPELEKVEPVAVWVDGIQVALREEGVSEVLFQNEDVVPDWLHDTMHLSPSFGEKILQVQAPSAMSGEVAVVRAMEMYDGYFKRAFEVELPVKEGKVLPNAKIDIAKISIVDRHHATETASSGFVRGFNLEEGALAATTNCENQNLVILGTNDADMVLAGETLATFGGGYVAVANGEVLACLKLPLAGIMSDEPWENVLQQSDEVNAAAASLGCEMEAPFMILAFVGLAGVPDLGLTERGLIDAASQQFVPLVVCCRCPQHIHDLSK